MASKKKVIFCIISILAVLMIAFFLYSNRKKIGKIITPFFMAVLIAYLLNPLVIKLENKKISRSTAILLLYLAFFIIIISVSVFIVPELIKSTKELMNTIPDITSWYQQLFNSFVSVIESSNWSEDIKDALFREIQNGMYMAQSYITDTLKRSLTVLVGTVTMFFDLLLAMVIAYYFIKDARFFKDAALSLVPRKWRNGVVGAGREINHILSNFIQGQLLVAFIVGILETIGLTAVGVKYSLVLGLAGGIANVIPYFGPIIGGVPAVAVALLQSPVRALWAVLVFVIVQQLDNSFISPRIIEGRLGLHPVTTVLAVLVGGEFFGVLGMLLSVPVTAIIKVLIKRSIEAIV